MTTGNSRTGRITLDKHVHPYNPEVSVLLWFSVVGVEWFTGPNRMFVSLFVNLKKTKAFFPVTSSDVYSEAVVFFSLSLLTQVLLTTVHVNALKHRQNLFLCSV